MRVLLLSALALALPMRASAAGEGKTAEPALPIGHTVLPAQVPYLNPPSRYVVGSGVAMACGEPAGDWIQLAGPGYTNHNLLTREDFALEVDGREEPLVLQMKRASRTGLYYGVGQNGDLRVRLVDFARWGRPWVTRLIVIDNTSATASHSVRVRARITPREAVGITSSLVVDAKQNPCAVSLRATQAAEALFPSHPNTIEGAAVISFVDPAATVSRSGAIYTLDSPLAQLAPHGSNHAALCHFFHAADAPDLPSLASIRSLDAEGELAKSIAEWQHWYAAVAPRYRLENIPDERARAMVEGGLAVIKTNQSADGGFTANLTFFPQGFIRDSVLGQHGMSATGHFDELKGWLKWEAHKFDLYGHISDASTCMPSLQDPSTEFDKGNNIVEGTALCLICAHDYFAATHDLATLKGMDKFLRYCMETQLQQAIANGEKLEFNGDETEICGAIDITPAGTLERFDVCAVDWSLSSIALCAASLDFYIQYVKAIGEDPHAYHSTLSGTTLDLPAELGRLVSAMDRDFWRTDVPGLSAGFHDAFRLKKDGGWPVHRITNICLMPVYFGTPYSRDGKIKDVAAIAHYFDPKTGFLQLVPDANTGFDGHDLGYLLWGLVETGNPGKDVVYHALVNGPTSDAWGAFHEAYDANGVPNDHDLRTMETGVNISAITKYWNLGKTEKSR